MIEYVVVAWISSNICRHQTSPHCLIIPPTGGLQYPIGDETICIKNDSTEMGAWIAIEFVSKDHVRVTIPPHAHVCKAKIGEPIY